MEDFSNDLFSSFFDDHLLAERNPLLDMDLDPPNPDIQAEHSYSLSGDSAPQSPSMPIKSDNDAGSNQLSIPYSFFFFLVIIYAENQLSVLDYQEKILQSW